MKLMISILSWCNVMTLRNTNPDPDDPMLQVVALMPIVQPFLGQ